MFYYKSSRGLIGEGNINSSLESSPDGGIESPGQVGGSEHQHTLVVVADSLHLDQELGLDPPRGLVLAVGSGPAERVDLVDEDDGGFLLPGHLEEGFDQLF